MNITVPHAPFRRRLSNGLFVNIFPQPDYRHTFVSWSVPYGSIHDIDAAGTAHFLEHMMFYNPDKQDLKALFHAEGASTSALTRYDVTTFQLACTGNLISSLELLMSTLATPYFTREDVERERAAIHQELAMYEDQPSWLALQQMLLMMYGAGHPIAKDVAGTTESVDAITIEGLTAAYNTQYQTSRMAVSVAGPVNPFEIMDLLERYPADVQQKAFHAPFSQPAQNQEGNDNYREIHYGLPVPLVRFGFRAGSPPTRLEDQAALMIGLEALLGETSTFFADCVSSGLLGNGTEWDHYYRQDFSFSNACGYSVAPYELYHKVAEQCRRVTVESFSLDNLEHARMKWMSSYYADMDSLKKRCMHISEYEVIGLNYMQLGECAMALTDEEVRVQLKRMANPEDLQMSVVR